MSPLCGAPLALSDDRGKIGEIRGPFLRPWISYHHLVRAAQPFRYSRVAADHKSRFAESVWLSACLSAAVALAAELTLSVLIRVLFFADGWVGFVERRPFL